MFDLGRTDFAIRTGLGKKLIANRWGLVVAGSTIQYRIVEGAIAKYYATYTTGLETVKILNIHTPEVFTTPDGSSTIIQMDYAVPLGANINMNQGDTIN